MTAGSPVLPQPSRATLLLGLLGQLVSMGTLLAFVLVCIGILILLWISPDLPRPFRTPGLPWVPLAGALICLVRMASLPWPTWERLFIWLFVGFGVYFGYGRRRAADRRQSPLAVAVAAE